MKLKIIEMPATVFMLKTVWCHVFVILALRQIRRFTFKFTTVTPGFKCLGVLFIMVEVAVSFSF